MARDKRTMEESNELWAISLVGRDWEIYWSEDDSCQRLESDKEGGDCDCVDDNTTVLDVEEEDDDDDDDEEDVEDWYDGYVEAIESVKENGNYSFRVRFEGDDTRYSMILLQNRVRPSAKAWNNRSKAILNCPDRAIDWETFLPPDTSTNQDKQQLLQIESLHVTSEVSSICEQPNELDSEGAGQIKRLAEVVRSQIFLHSRLAPMVKSMEELYSSHLLDCLNDLDLACSWYLQSWTFQQSVLYDRTSSLCFSETHAIINGLQQGRRVITNLLRIDTSVAGSKRKRLKEVSPGATRKTKRRRKNKALVEYIKESERGTVELRPEEDEFLDSDAVISFVQQVNSNDDRWYTKLFSRMIHRLSTQIVTPMLLWRHQAEILLGDRPDSEIDEYGREGETSQEGSDNEVNGSRLQISLSSKRYFTFDDVKAALDAIKIDKILRRFDLKRWEERLQNKLYDIASYEKQSWGLVGQLFRHTEGSSRKSDLVYLKLEESVRLAFSSSSAVGNINPLGSTNSALSRKVLDDALAIRCWYLDLRKVESSRERLEFIDKMAKRAAELPRLPSCDHSAALDDIFEKAVARLRKLSQGYFDQLTRFNKYRSFLLSRTNDATDDGIDLMSCDGVRRVLSEMGENAQVITVAEEMLSARLDVLHFRDKAQRALSKPNIHYGELLELKTAADSVLCGTSETREKLLRNIEQNGKVDSEVRAFAEADMTAFCGPILALINSKYSTTCSWKHRTDPVLCSLRHYKGVHSICNSQRLPPKMVDYNRIAIALEEYESLEVYLPEDKRLLQEAYRAADVWSRELMEFLMDKSSTIKEMLGQLESSRLDRPNGILVDPARHVVENLVNILQWHQTSVRAMHETSRHYESVGSDDFVMTKAIPKQLHELVAEGAEVLERFSERFLNKCCPNHVIILDLMCKQLESRRPLKVISLEKLESTPLGRTVLNRVIAEDESHGGPLRYLLLVLWHVRVADFVSKYARDKGSRKAATFSSAKDLVLLKPTANILSGNRSQARMSWEKGITSHEKKLMELMSEADRTEKEANRLLLRAKEMFKRPYRQKDAVQQYLLDVREIVGCLKARVARGGSGLVLDTNIELQLDNHLKVLAWLVRTFPYPFLHMVHYEQIPHERVPWRVLVTIADKQPACLEKMGDCAGIALRAAELCESAKAWQEEISKVTMISIRGGRRRGDCLSSECDSGSNSTIDVGRVNRLAKDPVLRKVSMPRESAVSEILQTAKAFEVHLHRFLGEDYNGPNPDRAPYPDTPSLVGDNGEFLLYRFTGSSLYAHLLSSIDFISMIAEDVLADTEGKAAFEWIRKSVFWIESLRTAVVCKSTYHGMSGERLVIEEADARSILECGKSFFLDIPEDLRKTLSTHRIFVSVSKVGGKLKVVLKKGGAHHSLGGTAIRWCSFLFESLKQDLDRSEKWKSAVEVVQSTVEQLQEVGGSNGRDINYYVSIQSLIEDVEMLFEEGIAAIMVSSSNEAFDKLRRLQKYLTRVVQQSGNETLFEHLPRRRFETPQLLLQDRPVFLDSLLARSSFVLETSDRKELNLAEPEEASNWAVLDGTFRSTCRAYFEAAMQRTLQNVGLRPSIACSCLTSTLCTLKSWEIEVELFSRFQKNVTGGISLQYKEKARSIKFALEASIASELCIEVLLGELEVPDLVSMTSEELVGQKRSVQGTAISINQERKVIASASESGDVACQRDQSPSYDALVKKSEASQAPTKNKKSQAHQCAKTDAGKAPAATVTICNNATPRPPPHAPPSLAAKLVSQPSKIIDESNSKREKYILNAVGSNLICISVSKPVLKFKAQFCREHDNQADLQKVLPDSLSERGRLRIQEFSKFLSCKLNGGRWEVIPVRISASSDVDAKIQEQFYKQYESMKRIAMFSGGDSAKVFLITPKFHPVATELLGVAFRIETSTYAIVIKRRDHK